MNLAKIMAALDACDVATSPALVGEACVECSGPITPHRHGRPALCLTCTLAELGLGAYDLALMIEFRLSRKAYFTRLEKFGWPNLSPKAWITPRTRLF